MKLLSLTVLVLFLHLHIVTQTQAHSPHSDDVPYTNKVSHDNKTSHTGVNSLNSNRVGKDKAIEDYNAHYGFRLSSVAQNNLQVNFITLEQDQDWRIPSESLVYIKDDIGVYRRRKAWITFVKVHTHKINGTHLSILSPNLKHGDEVAITGSHFLRMIEADLNSNATDAHAH